MKSRMIAAVAATLAALSVPAWSQTAPAPAPAAAPAAPQFETTKVEGTDNVYIFRAGGAQSMFIVTKDGVIATDPIAYANRQASQVYVDEIRKITKQPIKYLIYSHHHFDHIAGAKPFKDAGATIIAHQKVNERLKVLKDPFTPLADETFATNRTINLGGTTLELHYLGLNHGDTNLVMRLPKERIIFTVDWVPVGSLPGRAMIDSFPLEWEEGLKKLIAMDWDRLIPPATPARLPEGSAQDAQDILVFLQESSAEVQKLARDGKCWDPAEKEFQMPKYSSWPGYGPALGFVARRYCGLWGRGT